MKKLNQRITIQFTTLKSSQVCLRKHPVKSILHLIFLSFGVDKDLLVSLLIALILFVILKHLYKFFIVNNLNGIRQL